MSTLVDSNVIIDVLSEDRRWFEWSAAALVATAERSALFINPIVYSELAVGYSSPAAVDKVLPEERFERLPLPFEATYLAGRAYLAYRRKGSTR